MSDEKQSKIKRLAAPEPVLETEVAPTPPEPVVAPSVPAVRAAPAADADRFLGAYRQALAAMGQSQTAIAADVAAMALEVSGLARANLTVAGDTMTALCTATSLADLADIQLGFMRKSLDALAQGSTRMGEIAVRLADDAGKPMLGRFVAG